MPLPASYTPHYFSIDDILVTQERTPCKFLIDVPTMGKLNPSSEEADLKAGTVLELPMWLVQPLARGAQAIVAADLPRVYKEAYREILKADPCAVELHKFGIHFYELGQYAKKFDSRGDVSKILLQTFKARFRQLMDLAYNTASDPTINSRLDSLEQKLFHEGQTANTKMKEWFLEAHTPLEAANMVINHKKRKRVEIDGVL